MVGLELGPGDEPLLPGTLIPMRGVRASDDPPPMFSMATTPGGASGGDYESAGFGAREAGDGEGMGGEGSVGAKTDSMRRCVSGLGLAYRLESCESAIARSRVLPLEQ